MENELNSTAKIIDSLEVQNLQNVEEKAIQNKMKSIIELQEKENYLLRKISDTQKNLDKKKQKAKSILFLEIAVIPLFFVLFTFSGNVTVLEPESDSNTYYTGMFNSRYMVENLSGEAVDSWKSWHILEGTTLNVNLMNANVVSPEKINIIKNAIFSEEIQVGKNRELYYAGWAEALNSIKSPTKRVIPTNFNVIQSKGGEGEIIVILSNVKDAHGYTGYTKSIVEDNQILKSFITIYDVNNLSDIHLATIFRHEFGHALGLSHANNQNDLMAPTIDMTNPLISTCNVSAIYDLYNEEFEGVIDCKT